MRKVNQFLFSLLLLFSTQVMAEFDERFSTPEGKNTNLSNITNIIISNSLSKQAICSGYNDGSGVMLDRTKLSLATYNSYKDFTVTDIDYLIQINQKCTPISSKNIVEAEKDNDKDLANFFKNGLETSRRYIAKLQELKAYRASQGGNGNQRSANSGSSSNSSNRNNTSGSSASNGGSSYDSPSSSNGSGTTNEGKDPQADYTGQACSYFTKPAVEADGSRINAYSEGAYVCYGQKMYQCKNKQWAKRGNCIVFSDWQSLKAEVLENRSHNPNVLEGE